LVQHKLRSVINTKQNCFCFIDYFFTIDNDWTPGPKSMVTLPSFGPIEGHNWFFHISSQLESQKNRFAFISLAKIQFFNSPSFLSSPVHVAPPLLFQVVNGLEMPGPLPQPPGCRADTQIACPGSGRRKEGHSGRKSLPLLHLTFTILLTLLCF
jgi:hypothetical protein